MQERNETRTFEYGDPVVIYDVRRRPTSGLLKEGGESDFRGDRVQHAQIIGKTSGCRIFSQRGNPFWAFSPTLPEYALSMTRAATIIYPKDAAYLLLHADVGPGMRVVEGGFGSGAMTLALLRAVGESGTVVTYELRSDAATRAARNVSAFLRGADNHACHIGDIYDGIHEEQVDRVVLDVPEPWRVLDHAASALCDGGLIAAYVPTVLQMHTHILAARAHPDFFISEAVEVLERKWHLAEDSARPMHQMVGHTGYLCFSRRIARPSSDA